MLRPSNHPGTISACLAIAFVPMTNMGMPSALMVRNIGVAIPLTVMSSQGEFDFIGPHDLIGPRKQEEGRNKVNKPKRNAKRGKERDSDKAPGDGDSTTHSSGGIHSASAPSFSAKHRLWDYYAHDDGSINEWAPGWFVTHDWSESGKAILSLGVGDTIVIDGIPIEITSRGSCLVDDDYESVRSNLGGQCVVLQTCAGDGVHNVLLTGMGEGMGPYEVPQTEARSEERVTYVNDYGEFATYEEAEAAIEAHMQEEQEMEEDEMSSTADWEEEPEQAVSVGEVPFEEAESCSSQAVVSSEEQETEESE